MSKTRADVKTQKLRQIRGAALLVGWHLPAHWQPGDRIG
jgi:hypothetical protein